MIISIRKLSYSGLMFALIVALLVVIGSCSAQMVRGQFGANMEDCPAHSTFNRCMSRCPVTCSNYQNPQQHHCLQVCTVGCECHPGFIKVSKSPYSQCVKSYECPLYTLNKRTAPYPSLRKKLMMQQQMQYKNTNQTNTVQVGGTTSSSSQTPKPQQ